MIPSAANAFRAILSPIISSDQSPSPRDGNTEGQFLDPSEVLDSFPPEVPRLVCRKGCGAESDIVKTGAPPFGTALTTAPDYLPISSLSSI